MAIFVSVILGFSFAASSSTSAVSTSASASSSVALTVSDVISMHLLDQTATDELSELVIDITPTPVGSFSKNSLLTEVSTSNPSGYTLYLTSNGTNPVGDTSSNPTYTNALVNTDSTIPAATGTIPSLPAGTSESPTSITEAEFRVANSLYKTKWGYSVNALDITQASGTTPATITNVTDTSAITYSDIPAHNVSKAISTVSSSSESYLTPVTIGVNASSSIAAGVYQNTLEFTATTNAIPTDYSLTFNMNGSDSGNTGSTTPVDITESTISNMPSTNPMTASSVATSYTFTIPSTEPETSASGYEFKEWNTSPDGTGTSYAPGDGFTITVDDLDPYSPNQTLYAIWKEIPNFWDITYMQEMTTDTCDALYTPSNATGSSVTMITDKATYESTVTGNNQPYVAQRTLYDYRGLDGTGTKDAPATGSNMAGYTVSKLADGNCWMTSNLNLELSVYRAIEIVTNSTGEAKSTKWAPTSGSTNSAYPLNDNTVCTGSGTSRQCWYSWYAATAGSGTPGQTYTDATDSICPAGWRLPRASGGKSYYTLLNTYSATSGDQYSKLEANPMLFTRAGFYDNGSLNNSGWSGHYQSSTPSSNSRESYFFSYYTSSTNPIGYDLKYKGYSVRCLAV